MNKVILMGRLTKDPIVNSSANGSVARYTLAVDRRFVKRDDANAQTADFISIVVFGKGAEFAEKYLHKGTKVVVSGRIQTGSYQKDGQTIYTTDVVAEDQEFAESKNAQGGSDAPMPSGGNAAVDDAGFMNVTDGAVDDVPFI